MTDPEQRHLIAPRSKVSQEMREAAQPHKGMVFWLTGLSGAGKSTLAHGVEEALFQRDYNIVVLDGDAIRQGLCGDLGFSPEERNENIRRIAELSKIFVRNGTICLCAFISPSAESRSMAREIVGEAFFREIFIRCSVEECERRDVKGFYHKAKQGLIANYTGVGASYEPPLAPEYSLCTERVPVERSTEELLRYIVEQSSK